MNEPAKKWAWRLAKLLLAAAILFGVGRQFYRDLSKPADSNQPDLSELHVRPAWLLASGGLYLAALSFSAWYWYRLLWIFGQRPTFLRAYRAYFIGQLGKYVPGKAWALLLRGGLVRGPDVGMGVAIITAFYEVLTTMAAGAFVAAVVFLLHPPEVTGLKWHPLFTVFLLLGLCGLPLLPGVFNFLTQGIAKRFSQVEAQRLHRIRILSLVEGLLTTTCGWACLGLAVWCLFQAVLPEPPPLTPAIWAQFCASIGLAYVAGFLAFVLPGGVGVREYFLRELLGFAGPDQWIAAAVLLLRLVWTSAELVLSAMLFLVKRPAKNDAAQASPGEANP